ncbi:MAG TPA: hypothetical protein VM290_00715, partial [Gaiellaceae bacterium]|nr:hypothetical protein [Gaiellaceae bacterium]
REPNAWRTEATATCAAACTFAAWLQWHWDPCWHRACDEPSRISAAKVQAAAQVAVASVRQALGSR